MKRNVDVMHCLEISLIEVKKNNNNNKKPSSVALAFSQACGWRHLALQRGFWNWSSVAWMLAYVESLGWEEISALYIRSSL